MKKYLDMIPERLKSPVVWFGIIATVLVAAKISPENLTSWDILWNNLVASALNPFIVGSVIVQVYSYLNNPTDKAKF